MEEIKAILTKHDIAGFVILHTPGFSEYVNQVTPGYSCAVPHPGGLSFKLNSSEVSNEAFRHIANATFNMITAFAEVTAMHALLYMDAERLLKEKLEGEQFPGGHTSHDQQNN